LRTSAFLMQTLVPYCNAPDEDIQTATIRVLHALIPGFRSASAADIAFAWSYFCALLDGKSKPALLITVINLVRSFPIDRITILSGMAGVHGPAGGGGGGGTGRREGDAISKITNAPPLPGSAKCVLDRLVTLTQPIAPTLSPPLGLVKDSLHLPLPTLLKTYDELATALAAPIPGSPSLATIVQAVGSEASADEFWNFFLADVPENQLVRPDDYPYWKNFVHAPFWVAIVLCKLGVLPPPGDTTARDIMPTTPAGRRRFICGFMLCLLPSCGMPDPTLRKAACISMLLCSFRHTTVHPGVTRGVLEFVSQLMLSHKQWTFQLSALDILCHIVRLKIPQVSATIPVQYLDLAMDVAYNTPSSIVKIGALDLVRTVLLVFPHAAGVKLQEIRDIVRLYPLVFSCVNTSHAPEFVEYLRSEIN
ncbi:hypothetical protein BDK51DRAFT_30371, partial [Blyttiomyces helicus]